MSNSSEVASFYKGVVDEVIRNVRTEFVNMGVDEQVLVDLQMTWEQKLIEQRVFQASDYPMTTVRDFGGPMPFFYPSVLPPSVPLDMMAVNVGGGGGAYLRRPVGGPIAAVNGNGGSAAGISNDYSSVSAYPNLVASSVSFDFVFPSPDLPLSKGATF